jgi:hypothetical protein
MNSSVIHAFTPPGATYPPYINLSRLEDGSVKVTVRSEAKDGNVGETSTMVLSEADWRSLAWSVYSETNDRERGSVSSDVPDDIVHLAREVAQSIPHAAFAHDFVRNEIEKAILKDRASRSPA